ncbi:MAG: ACP S-malonyltransferase [Bacilli bacterium]|nr:ACP S-malonyltransferase [Bacilli bacterium]
MNTKRIGLLCAGQGSQYMGMGRDFYDAFDVVQKMYELASKVLGYDISKICFTENELLNQTEFTQPAILLVTCTIYEIIKEELNIVVCSGFSLGEYSALYAAGVYDFPTVIDLISKRARFMNTVVKENEGAMAAIIGLDVKEAENLVAETNTIIANYNSPTQFVISGVKQNVLEAINKAPLYGARRALMLNVNGAFHHPMMKAAALKLRPYLDIAIKKEPLFPVIMNCDAQPLIDKLSEKLERQIYSPVRFEESVRLMVDKYEVDTFVEIGPGKVLSGLVKRIAPEAKIVNVENLVDLNNLRGGLK